MDNIDYSGFDPSWAQDPGSGYSIAPAIGLPANTAPPLPGDMQDASQMQPYAPLGNAMSWGEQAMLFGIGRAVDNLSRTNVGGNTDPGSFAGYNGRTYSQIPQGQGGGATSTAKAGMTVAGSPLLLIGLAVVAFVLLHKK